MKAVFAGTFDPFTMGHHDIAERAARLFDEVIIGVAVCHGREHAQALEQRMRIAEMSVADIANASVRSFDGLLTDFARECGAAVIVRGLRGSGDFEYERSLCEVYKGLDKSIECVYIISRPELAHVSSTVVRQLASLDGKIDGYVHSKALKIVKELYGA